MESIIGIAIIAAMGAAGLWGLAWRERDIKRHGREIQADVLARYGAALTDEFCVSFSREHAETRSWGKTQQGTTMAELADGTLTNVMVRRTARKLSVYRKFGDDWAPLVEVQKVAA